MNNEKIENEINKNNENEEKEHFYKINILKPKDKPKKKEKKEPTPINNNINNNRLFLSSPVKKRKKPDNNIKNILMSSFASKRGEPSINLEKKQNVNQNLLKTKKKPDNDKSKHGIFEIGSKNPLRKRNITNKNNNDNNNDSDVLNLLKFANNLYENDEHLSKDIFFKKFDNNSINNISNIYYFIVI